MYSLVFLNKEFTKIFLALSVLFALPCYSGRNCSEGLVAKDKSRYIYNPESFKGKLKAGVFVSSNMPLLSNLEAMTAIELRRVKAGKEESLFLKGFIKEVIGDQFIFIDLYTDRELLFNLNDITYAQIEKFVDFEKWNLYGLEKGNDVLIQNGDVISFELSESRELLSEQEVVSSFSNMITVMSEGYKKTYNIREINLPSLRVKRIKSQSAPFRRAVHFGESKTDLVTQDQMIQVYTLLHFLKTRLNNTFIHYFQMAVLRSGADKELKEPVSVTSLPVFKAFQWLGLMDEKFHLYDHVLHVAGVVFTVADDKPILEIENPTKMSAGYMKLSLPTFSNSNETLEAWMSRFDNPLLLDLEFYRLYSPKITVEGLGEVAATDFIEVFSRLDDYLVNGTLNKLRLQLKEKLKRANPIFPFDSTFRGFGPDERGLADMNGFISRQLLDILKVVLIDSYDGNGVISLDYIAKEIIVED